MGKKKGSNAAGALVVVLGGLVAVIAAVPKELWIGAAVLAVLGIAAYLHSQPKAPPPAAAADDRVVSEAYTPQVALHSPRQIVASKASMLVDDVPVSVGERTNQPRDYGIPAAPIGYGAATWVPSGKSIDVGGFCIPGGLIYVGTKLSTPSGKNDPCLIDPSKPVTRQGDYTERQMGYWPSYAEIPATARSAYLSWLAGGRKDPEADIGYVFLFFYGLERRAVIDAASDPAARADWPSIAAELRRLLDIYGPSSGSFRGYASSLLDWVALAGHPERLYAQPVPSFPNTFELPLYVRLALGQAAVDRARVPVHLALAWARLDPNIYLRTPATRCDAEFEQLFATKYAEILGAGMVLPRNRTKLKLVYRPASAGFHGYGDLELSFDDTPDVTVLTGPPKMLQQVVEAATQPLESFSRLIGKDPDAASSLEGLLLLPVPLWPESARNALQALKSRMGEGMVAMSFQDLLRTLNAKSAFTRDKTLALARMLESANVGFEPDVLGGAKLPKPEDKVVLFTQPATEPLSRSNGPYLAAALTLQLASAVASVDGEFGIPEMGHLRRTVLSWSHLTPSQTRRLLAHLRLLMQAPASLATLKRKFEPLDLSVKETIAAFMATVAQSDGEVSPAEVKMLEKIYKALGVDAKKVFSDVHAVAAGTKPTVATVARVEGSGFKLDPARIAELQRDTDKVSALLAKIFTEVEDSTLLAAVESVETEAEADITTPARGLMGLDEAHSALARMLLSRPQWSRAELLDVSADLELMLDGALEHINDAAFEAYDVLFLEGEDPVTVNAEILERVEA